MGSLTDSCTVREVQIWGVTGTGIAIGTGSQGATISFPRWSLYPRRASFLRGAPMQHLAPRRNPEG